MPSILVIGPTGLLPAMAEPLRQAGYDAMVETHRPVHWPASDVIEFANLATLADACDAVLLTGPWIRARETLRSAGPLAGKIVIDATNPVVQGREGPVLEVGHTTSGAEVIQSMIPQARVVKALNQYTAEALATGIALGSAMTTAVAGDDPDALVFVTGFLDALDIDWIEAGGLKAARLLEPMALFLQQHVDHGPAQDGFTPLDTQNVISLNAWVGRG